MSEKKNTMKKEKSVGVDATIDQIKKVVDRLKKLKRLKKDKKK